MVLGIIAFGMTMVMILGEIDLSVGSIAAFSCAFGGLFVDSNSSLLVIMLTLLAGTFCGFLRSGALPRIEVWNSDSENSLERKIEGQYNWLNHI